MTKHISEEEKLDREAANKLISACKHFGIDPKVVAKIIGIIKAELKREQDDKPKL